ncbi:unnamed protein product [Larinioides sclopetarius]|uniref:Uncharacterized protein n=1 Tax=Larinioides sclopetarius TaxID=280406 RepID=A0AAV1YT10_9ARAC
MEARHGLRRRRSIRPAERIAVVTGFYLREQADGESMVLVSSSPTTGLFFPSSWTTGKFAFFPSKFRDPSLWTCRGIDWAASILRAGLAGNFWGVLWWRPLAASERPTIDRGTLRRGKTSRTLPPRWRQSLPIHGRSNRRRRPREGTDATRSPTCSGAVTHAVTSLSSLMRGM